MRRTLCGVAIGALIAMSFVPVYYGHYEPLIAAAGDRINIPQLLVNVTFMALLGALCANMSKRVALWTGGAAALIAVVALWLVPVVRAENDEQYAKELIHDANWWRSWNPSAGFSADEIAAKSAECLAAAKEKLLCAADNWHWAGNWAREKRLRLQANFTPPPPKFDPSTAKPVGDIFDQVAAEPAHGTITEDDIAATGSPSVPQSSTPATDQAFELFDAAPGPTQGLTWDPKQPLLVVSKIKSIRLDPESGDYQLTFTDQDAKKLAQITEERTGKLLIVVSDEKAVVIFRLRAPIVDGVMRIYHATDANAGFDAFVEKLKKRQQ